MGSFWRAPLPVVLLSCAACSGGEIDSPGEDAGPADGAPAADVRPDAPAADRGSDSASPSGDRGSCPGAKALAGTYQGTFKGNISSLGASSGTVSFTLLQQGADEFLTIKTGTMSGKVKQIIPYSADLQGTVTCGSMKANIVNGKSAVEFKGEMKGSHTGSGFSGGTWSVTYLSGGALGSGTWQATRK